MPRTTIITALLVLSAACSGGVSDTAPTQSTPSVAPGSSSTAGTAAPPTTGAPSPSSSVTTAPTTSSSTVPEPESVTVADGTVTGPETIEVQLGTEAVFTVTADVADEVHVHGYDLTFEMEPGVPAAIRFLADVPGVFEVELEAARLPLVELTVLP